MYKIVGGAIAALLLASMPAQASCTICATIGCHPSCCLKFSCNPKAPCTIYTPPPPARCWGTNCQQGPSWGMNCRQAPTWGHYCTTVYPQPCDPCVTCPTPTAYRCEQRVFETKRTVAEPGMRVEMRQQQVTTYTPEWRDQKRGITVTTMQEVSYNRTVPVRTSVPTTVIDPCTGCPITVCKTVTSLQTEQVNALVPVKKREEITEKVMVLKPEQKTVECRVMVPEIRAVPHTKQEFYNVMVPCGPPPRQQPYAAPQR